MNSELRHDLELLETDLEGALARFSGDESFYLTCLTEFLNDSTMDMLNTALRNQAWDDAFTAAHALKGVAGNMGFVPLFHATAELVIYIRTGKMSEIVSANQRVNRCHDEIAAAIRRNIRP